MGCMHLYRVQDTDRADSEHIFVGNAILLCGHQLPDVGQAGQARMVEVEACWLADAGSQLRTLCSECERRASGAAPGQHPALQCLE